MEDGTIVLVPSVKGGTVNGYLNGGQMKALMAAVEERGVSRSQVVKEMIIRGLVSTGYLEEWRLKVALDNQFGLYVDPHGNAGKELVERSGMPSRRKMREERKARLAQGVPGSTAVRESTEDSVSLNEGNGDEPAKRVRRGRRNDSAGAASVEQRGAGAAGEAGQSGRRNRQRRSRS